ncbi:hypothetical protein C9J47_25655 [Photobacterium indicum]|jgi:hypothetical protein|uniref:DUF2799 domain-containing protein n=2 Tax=Photobacterium indicum TaxID=81447 RepID=A0A2T3L1Q1_9GAMM|nr:hypothetical protein C9J47_25655 [Photobacterium indicum]
MVRLMVFIVLIILSGCAAQYEADLSENKEWQQLGTYHGEQGYRELNAKKLNDLGALSETEYESYRAGYLKGRFDYCSGRKTVTTVINQGYPDDCAAPKQGRSSYSVIERGY